MDKAHPALVGGGGETRHTPHDTAPQGHQGGAAAVAVGQQRIVNQVQGLQGLILFAIREDQGVCPPPAPRTGDPADATVGHHQHLPAMEVGAEQG